MFLSVAIFVAVPIVEASRLADWKYQDPAEAAGLISIEQTRTAQNSLGWRFGNSRPKYSYARAVATRPRGVRSIIPICIR